MSSDDIVERLHVWADLVAGTEPLMRPVLTVDLRHTADEIERLRSEQVVPDGYEVTYATEFANGTIQLTLKPKEHRNEQ